MNTNSNPNDWQPVGDLRFRLVFYKADMRPLFAYAVRTVEQKVSMGEFPPPDYYEGKRAVWTRDTIQSYIKAKKDGHNGNRRTFPRKMA